jgi:DNA-binding response OmpR family regulator
MIGILTDREVNTNYEHEILDSVVEIHDGIKVLITDLTTIKSTNLVKVTDALIVIITRKYDHEAAKFCFKNNYNYYIQVNNKTDMDDFLSMLAFREVNTSSIVTVDQLSSTVIVRDEEIKLTSKEFLIFNYLHQNRGELCLRKTMLNDVFGYHADAESRIIDVYIKYLRTKLGSEGKKIETIRGQGYIYHH